MINAIEILEKQQYASSQEYYHELRWLEEMMGFEPDNKAHKEKYVNFVMTYGSRTPKSYALKEQLDAMRERDIMQNMNLDNPIAEVTGVPTGGEETSMLHRRRVQIGTNDDGTPIFKQIQAHSEEEANSRIVQAYIDSGRIREFTTAEESKAEAKSETNFKTYAESWMITYKKGKLKPRTWQTYNQYLTAQLFPAFGSVNIEDITTKDVQAYLNANKEQAGKSLKNYLNLLKQIFDSAVEDKIIVENPAASSRIFNPSDKKTPRKALSVDQLEEIIDAMHGMKNCEEKLLLALFIHTGARRGEVLGLRWEDIDFERNLIHIRRNNTQITGEGAHIGTTKTENGARDIPFGEHFKELLMPYRSSGYVFGGKKPFQSWDYDKLMRRLKKRVNLHGATAHVLRHTYLTMLAGEGVDLKTLQTIAGHANIQTTMDIYVSPRTDKITAAGETMDRLLEGMHNKR